ncbi:MAG: hypothetical protein PWQ88_586 [Candidatus Methanomethylophilaceae archaeon]|nr:hypothetical protein [Candidatus Methanomethylophilaceae archaeon]MDI3541579.1 hypothetical protein [Candidatus Methanomethylophilaceae archaeon]
MTGLTVAERILLHLSRFTGYGDEYNAPIDISQNGISVAVRISRAHAAIELKKLKELGLVEESLAHVKGSHSRRKVYHLTPTGSEKARQILDYAEKEGIDVSTLLDLSSCDPDTYWESLDEPSKKAFGIACVFRTPFDVDAVGEVGARLVPLDDNGLAFVPENMRSRIPMLMGEAELREAHSLAADDCLRRKDYRERFHHLVHAGRIREAAMLISSHKELFMKNPEGLNEDLSLLMDAPPKYRPALRELQAEAALAAGDLEQAQTVADALNEEGERWQALILEGKILLKKGDLEGALSALLEAEKHIKTIELECLIADVFCEKGEPNNAYERLEALLHVQSDDGEYDRIDMLLFHMGKSLLCGGRADEAIKYLSKGMNMVPEEGRKPWHRLLGEAYETAGIKDRAREHLRLSR